MYDILHPEEVPKVSILIGSQLRVWDKFAPKLSALCATPCDIFISSDHKSVACARNGPSMSNIRYMGVTPNTTEQILHLMPNLHTFDHLHQWWRIRDAWNHMRAEELRTEHAYETVACIRTDLQLPLPLPITRMAPDELVMRGDWVFWGARSAMDTAVRFSDEIPRYHNVGQHAYIPLPWKHMLTLSEDDLSSGMLTWLKYPRHVFSSADVANARTIRLKIASSISTLETLPVTKNGISGRDGWWKWNHAPDGEKFFFYHVLHNKLRPRNFLTLVRREMQLQLRLKDFLLRPKNTSIC